MVKIIKVKLSTTLLRLSFFCLKNDGGHCARVVRLTAVNMDGALARHQLGVIIVYSVVVNAAVMTQLKTGPVQRYFSVHSLRLGGKSRS